jgi:unsaturated rhamnogalacturonyl hydrolase
MFRRSLFMRSEMNTENNRSCHMRQLNSSRRFWQVMFAMSVLLMLLMLAYEARLYERLVARFKIPVAGFLDAQFSDKNFDLILHQTINDLNDLKLLHDVYTTDYSRTERLFRERTKNTSINHSHSLLALGIAASKPDSQSPAFRALEGFIAKNVDHEGNPIAELKEIEDYMVGFIMLEMYQMTSNKIYKQSADKIAQLLVHFQPKNRLGGLPYRSEFPDLMLVDDKGMICGFLIRYGVEFRDKDALNLGVLQLLTFLHHGMNLTDGLPYHAYDLSLDRKFGPSTWLRGIGWLAMGIADALEYLPKKHEARPEILASFITMLNTLRDYQEPDGVWRWDVNNPTAEIDTSGTAMIGYAIEKGIRSGALDPSWTAMSENALRGILRHTRADGTVDQALANCNGVGHYPRSFGPSNHAQGATLALFSLVRERHHNDSSVTGP